MTPAEITAPRASEPPVLRGDVTIADAFQRIVEADLNHLVTNLPAAQAGDIESVHQARVAIRRVRSKLALFAGLLEPHAAKRFEAMLARFGRVLGEARDWDVFCGEILPLAFDGHMAHWARLLGEEAEKHRQAAHRWLGSEIAEGALNAMALELGAWAAGRGESKPFRREDTGALLLAEVAPRLLDKLADKVDKRGRHIDRLKADELHALRKSLKKLRYAVDSVAGLYDPKHVAAYLENCMALQKRLGAINDAVAGTALARRLGQNRNDLTPVIQEMARHLDGVRQKHETRLIEVWTIFRRAPRFWL